MRIRVLTDPAAPDLVNEDAVALGRDLAVVVDGAGLRPEMRRGCTHPVAWYSRNLARELALRLEREGEERLSMTDALEGAIGAVRALHGGSCDLHAGSPSGTVAAWRLREGTLETLVLCDAAIVIGVPGPDGPGLEAELVTDLRVQGAVDRWTRLLAERPAERLAAPVEEIPLRFQALDAARNVDGGFWCAHHDPAAARHALVRSVPWRSGMVVIAASDGATRAMLELGTHDVERFAEQCAAGRLEELCEEVRDAERSRARRPVRSSSTKIHDDLTVAVATA
ncbi:hypothetical protein [Brachybacterium hainanense]|uniref:Integrase n=1 Tax=Brachybacterium hainanense TaxID=1541174 RepID=A0ABV6RB98_9MICO